jgi:hypothetical protein
LESLFSEPEKCAIQEENHQFRLTQVLFTGLAASAVIQLNEFDVTWNYFIRIHYHVRPSDLTRQFQKTLISRLNEHRAPVISF